MSILSDTSEVLKVKFNDLEEETLEKIHRAYVKFLDELREEFEELVRQILILKRQGKAVSKADLYRLTRLANSIRQLDFLIDQFNETVVKIVTDSQSRAIGLGIISASELLDKALIGLPKEVIEFVKNLSPSFLSFDERAVVEMTRHLIDGAPLSNILKKNNALAYDEVVDIFINAIIRGINPRVAARQFYEKLNMVIWRADTLARTEIVGTYRQVNMERYLESRVVKKWRWSATLDERVCPVCIYLDGKVFDLGTPFATHPNCRCAPIPITLTFRELGLDMDDYMPPYRESGVEWFDKQSDKFQKRILGPAKAKLYSAGQIDLSDLVGEKEHPIYGPVRYERSIKEMKRRNIL